MSDDKCRCGHEMVWHGEIGCEDCLCERFQWPVSDGGEDR